MINQSTDSFRWQRHRETIRPTCCVSQSIEVIVLLHAIEISARARSGELQYTDLKVEGIARMTM